MSSIRLSNIQFFADESIVTFELVTKQQTKNLIDRDEECSEISITVPNADPSASVAEAKARLKELFTEAASSF